ncbi:bis(5'-nucleosyl)-tetraphosphatase (symmetrical) [Denitratisoma sp. DHT3]|uniref:symmetrical bis(5'-nucleosyl)-tetraphosphatase n=1 Tax=Denitratisoma sp. DHT3 TaxID=1981880 RepID=UPI0011987853|nr:symmetrical bis(5'-nucleosyl)-tetraphosphatase [Denitratisoma sp. DHT3]QDX81828.1 bis(5'-nucleosyl)-tetraphosphatase (symmetrical) [Denitratisoma sp. DHT3]
MATYAIGDIQGCFDALTQLLDELNFDARNDRLWFVGDLVNRGTQSLETLRFVHSLGERAVVVLGNHDLHLIMQAEGHGRTNSDDTLQAVLAAPDRDELLDWLRGCPLFHVEGDYAMVHAGLLPQWSVAQAAELSAEVSRALRAPDYRQFLARMWGSEPAAWRDDLAGWERLRVVVNAMTRMRFCSAEGVMDFRSKGALDSAPPGQMPWFAVPGRASADHTLICGHWSALGLRVEPRLLALDTGCLWGGSLTAVRLEDRRVFQLPCRVHVQSGDWG